METFTTSIEIGDPSGRRWQQVDVLVDSGATFTMLPRSLLEHLDVRPQDKVPFELADGRSIESDVGETSVRIGNRVRTTLVVFGDNSLQPLLGAYTLEAFLLAVDPVNRRLVPVSGLLKRFPTGVALNFERWQGAKPRLNVAPADVKESSSSHGIGRVYFKRKRNLDWQS